MKSLRLVIIMKKILLLAMVLGLVSASQAEEWFPIRKDKSWAFYDKDSLFCVNGIVTVWIRHKVPPAPQETITESRWLFQYNCASLERRILLMVWYRKDGSLTLQGPDESVRQEPWTPLYHKGKLTDNETLDGIADLMFFCKTCQK